VLRRLGIAAVLTGALALPGSALAHNTYVDRTDGTGGTNDCKDKSNPCLSLTKGITNAGHEDTVFVGGDPHVYESPHTLDNGKSLVHKDFSTKHSVDTSGKAIIDTGNDPDPALTISGSAGVVKGFTIRSETLPLSVQGAVTVKDNRLDEDAQIVQDMVLGSHGLVKILDNTFRDPTPLTGSGDDQMALHLVGSGKRVVSGNFFRDFQAGIYAESAGNVKISHNEFQGNHPAGSDSGVGLVALGSAAPDIVGNLFHAPYGGPTTNGIVLQSGGTIERDRIWGYDTGVVLQDTPQPTKLDSVAITTPYAGAPGLRALDTGPLDQGVGDAKATNLTISGQGNLILLLETKLTLDSSILDGGGVGGTGGTCTIKFSRGPTKTSGGNGCAHFQTTKGPKLEPDNQHLKPGSPMIDAGNKHKPPHGAKDFDGDKRAIACGHGKARRDIGADEVKC
jgi:hypothetical protein